MKFTKMGYLIMNLMIVSIFSIGFANWIIVEPTTSNSIDGVLSADQIVDNKSWITFEPVESLSFSQAGFIKDKDGTKNNINIKMNVNIKDIRKYYGSSLDKLQIDAKLSYNNTFSTTMDIFKFASASINNINTNISISGSGGYLNSSISIPVRITNIPLDIDNFSFNIIYTFKNVDQEFFSNLASPLRRSDCFYVSAKVLLIN